jgi:aryl-alcohol dehydrogenase-like predicted oxidoreductase
MDRRDFLTAAAAAPLAAAAQEYPKRLYKDGIRLSIVGFGGIVVNGQEQPAADRQVAASFDRGINYFDVAPTYGQSSGSR